MGLSVFLIELCVKIDKNIKYDVITKFCCSTKMGRGQWY